MRGGSARLACLLGALMTLSLGASAQAARAHRQRVARLAGRVSGAGRPRPQQQLHLRRHARQQPPLPHRRPLRHERTTGAVAADEQLQRQAREPRSRRRGQVFTFSAKEVHADYDFRRLRQRLGALHALDARAPALAEPLRLIEAGETEPVGAGQAGDADRLGRHLQRRRTRLGRAARDDGADALGCGLRGRQRLRERLPPGHDGLRRGRHAATRARATPAVR